ncbi:MAG: four helix bundle protein [Candidatus Levybacteria bacterium RIFCSPHIGHO2_02_FULL_40_18]|nr:MAG: four helix bundle protein [Candidatus Levybacteria bacterium RIFCSPHIGHO2_01_FULL_40_58]OGH27208.1 MAG: four helix bundle protein [Candidatus Levybacteria bacterium RIFCSPHIGHO2_02_FULL_40_18]OGH31067.1 MAG: four helix bundle protein [Candidatus Levybacteria bacterium RIFCSPHIGHO2_12_FULL_40_31]OGH40765.1 MAG: four helix bundle protein [Candidatus Levybacteria bacterium RIFCSPLOWO2_01_FULL_40_64]OGH49403.1 MAG: four helix bundle protein [Candidatus Levybacteria bacterium RIFCSPLOWO2_02_
MTIKTFEDIVAWRKSKDLCIEIYRIFRSCKDYSFRDQIFRAAISVMNNIAEGYERNGNKEFRNFLFIAKGSCGELRSMLHIALELKYITRGQYDKLLQESITISKMLSGLIKAL